jgi:hypothetical protein
MMFGNPMIPMFEGKKEIASGISIGEVGNYVGAFFAEDFPQFYGSDGACLVPQTMLDQFTDMANDSVLPSHWGKSWRYAAGLFTAHYCALYLKTYRDSSDSPIEAASGADMVGVVKSATMGDTSVSYDNTAVTAGTEKWGTWNATQYGSQLVTMARSLGIAGSYVV